MSTRKENQGLYLGSGCGGEPGPGTEGGDLGILSPVGMSPGPAEQSGEQEVGTLHLWDCGIPNDLSWEGP